MFWTMSRPTTSAMVTGTMALGANTSVVANSGSQDTSCPK